MGYRSQVRCIIYGSPEILDSFIAKHAMQNNPFLTEMREYIRYGLIERVKYHSNGTKESCPNKVLDFYGDSFKWYDEYDDVAGLNKIMDDIDENYEETLDFEFIRVGEETKDIETKGSTNCYGYIYPITTIADELELEDLPNEKD